MSEFLVMQFLWAGMMAVRASRAAGPNQMVSLPLPGRSAGDPLQPIQKSRGGSQELAAPFSLRDLKGPGHTAKLFFHCVF